MKLLFLGFAVPKSIMDEICRNDQHPQIAAYKLQWDIINGIEKASGQPVDLISSIPVSDYPLFPGILITGSKWSHRNGSNDLMVPFVNIIVLKHVTRLASCFFSVAAWLFKNRCSRQRQIIVYALHSPHVFASVAATTLLGGEVVLIIPDLPMYMDSGIPSNFIRKLTKPIDSFLLIKIMKRVRGLIVLTEQVAHDFAPGVPSLVMEGAVSLIDMDETIDNEISLATSENDQKIIMYAGNLKEAYGVGLLIDAFSLIPGSNYSLWILGKGDMEQQVKDACIRDKRIIYYGFIPPNEMMRKALQSTVLLNPRPSDSKFTFYSFPSKLLDYMKTGRPVITTALPGIPKEYYDYVYLLNDESPESLAKLLQEICSKDSQELARFGQRAKDFVLQNKSYVRQGQRICEFLRKL